MRGLILVAALLPLPAFAGETPGVAGSTSSVILDLIDTNLSAGRTALADSSQLPAPLTEAPEVRLWIHVRSPAEVETGDSIGALLTDGVKSGPITRQVELKSVEAVDFGPDTAQVRYFRPEDEVTASEIAKTLGANGVAAEPSSFVGAFGGNDAVPVGTIEIWLPVEKTASD